MAKPKNNIKRDFIVPLLGIIGCLYQIFFSWLIVYAIVVIFATCFNLAHYKLIATIIWLFLPTNVCLAGAEGRIGSEREDMPWQEEELSAEFRDFIINFSRDEIPEINEMLRKYKNKNIIIFKSREEIDAWK